MGETAKILYERARTLPAAERLELVDEILATLDETDPAIDRLWVREAEERLAAWRHGEIRAAPLAEVLCKYDHT